MPERGARTRGVVTAGKQMMARGPEGDRPRFTEERNRGRLAAPYLSCSRRRRASPWPREGRPPRRASRSRGPSRSRSAAQLSGAPARCGRSPRAVGGRKPRAPPLGWPSRVAATLMPRSWAAGQPPEKGVGRFGWRKAKLRGPAQRLPPSGFASVLGKWGERRKPRVRGSTEPIPGRRSEPSTGPLLLPTMVF